MISSLPLGEASMALWVADMTFPVQNGMLEMISLKVAD